MFNLLYDMDYFIKSWVPTILKLWFCIVLTFWHLWFLVYIYVSFLLYNMTFLYVISFVFFRIYSEFYTAVFGILMHFFPRASSVLSSPTLMINIILYISSIQIIEIITYCLYPNAKWRIDFIDEIKVIDISLYYYFCVQNTDSTFWCYIGVTTRRRARWDEIGQVHYWIHVL